jgi:hypothetical protein
VPPDEPLGKNPPDGAIIDYFLAKPASGEVTLEILDGAKVVRRYSSEDKPELNQEQLQLQLIPIYWVRPAKSLPTDAGMHRWVWDLHYPAPSSAKHEYPISAVPGDTPRVPLGPLALPGQYTVRLTTNGASYTAPLTVKIDPRVKVPASGLALMFQAQTRLAEMLSRSTTALLQARSAREQIESLSGKTHDGLSDAVAALKEKIAILLDGMHRSGSEQASDGTLSRVNSDTGSLYAEIDRADAAPTAAQVKALAEIERDFPSMMKQWDEIRTTAIPALNQRLNDAGLSEIVIEANPRTEEEPHGDEE